MHRITHWTLALVLILLTAPTAAAQSSERCFPETGHCISGRIRAFWEQNGGLPVFGFPIGPEQDMTIEGQTVRAQNFERNRLELHPENRPPFDVLLGRLGADRLAQQGRDWFAFPKSEPQPACRFFAETGHTVCGAILGAWRANGLELDGRRGKTEAESLALFGLPLSGVVDETLSDGRTYQVQWFERARFELHPENPPPYNVLLGLLGNELRDAGSGAAAPPANQPIVISGSGARVTDPITLPAAYNRVNSVHQGESNFIVRAYTVGKNERELLANAIGDHAGSRPLEGQKQVFFEVAADGNWTLTIEALPQEPGVVNGASGRGEYTSGLFQPPRSGPVAYTFSHDGESNFIVIVRCAGVFGDDLAVNEIGPYWGEAVVEFGRGPCYWDVDADGNWNIQPK